jgi:hypothetical protein
MAEEAVLTLSNSTHHIFGGMMMLAGQQLNNPTLWLHGMLVEIGFEITDLVCLALNKWPYPQIQPRLRIVTVRCCRTVRPLGLIYVHAHAWWK